MSDAIKLRQSNDIDDYATHLEKERMEKALCSLMVQETEICVEFANSKVGKVIELFLKDKGIQLSNINAAKLTKLINITNEIMEIHRQSKSINQMIHGRTVLTKEFDELSIVTLIELSELKEFSQKLVDLKNQQAVLEELINTNYENQLQNSPNALTEMLMEFWSDSE